jgi:hypothetical protein
MMKRMFLALFSLGVASLAWAQAGEQVTAPPSFKPGDSWTYVRTDRFSATRNMKYVVTIKSVSDSGHETSREALEGTITGSGDLLTREMNPIVLEDQKYEPYISVYSFPLAPGKKWEGTYTFTSFGALWEVTRTNRVDGWETVKTAAGEFKALKIIFSGNGRSRMGSFTGHFDGILWYSPEVRRLVLQEFKSQRPPRDERLELVGFKPAP